MRNQLIFYSILVIYVIIDVGANFWLKKWLDTKSYANFATAMVLYVGCGAAWALSLCFKDFNKAQLVYSPIALICGVIIVMVCGSRDDITTTNWMGVILAFVAILMIEA